MVPPADCRDNLDAVLGFAWELIETAVRDRHAAFHIPVLATTALDGAPSARIVVLRAASGRDWRVRCHTDNRSSKFEQIRRDRRVMFHFYDPVHKIQIRAFGEAELHHRDETSLAAWQASATSSRQCYFADPGPGSPVTEPTNGLPEDKTVFEDVEIGLEAFTVVNAAISKLEWVHLDHRGHRRAVFEKNGDHVERSWLVP